VNIRDAVSRTSVRAIACAVAIVLVSARGHAQVLFDAASNATPATVSAAASITVSWNHTIGTAKKEYLTVSVAIDKNNSAQTVSGVSFGTEAGGPLQGMTLLGSATNGTAERAEIWGLANPTAGTHQITVTVANAGTANTVVVAGAKSFSNVFQTAANGTAAAATGTTLAPTVTTASSAFDYVVDAVAYNNNVALTAASGQTNTFNITSAAPVFSGASGSRTGAANAAMGWTATGVAAAWAEVAVPLQSASPQILFDTASRATTGLTSNANPVAVSWSHTTTTAANRYIVVGVSINLAGGTVPTNVNVTGVTYGGTAMTFLGGTTRTTTVRSELWGLANPASGANTIAVSVLNSGTRALSVTAGAQSFSNVDQFLSTGTAIGASGNSTVATTTTTNTPYDYVVDVVGFAGNTTLLTNLSQDIRWNTNTTGPNFASGSSGARGYTNIAMGWTTTSANWAIEAIPLKAVSVGLTKSATSDVIKLGDSITYTLRATNYSASTVTTVTITDPIPAGATFLSQTGCTGTGPVVCNMGSLAAGATTSPVTITVIANAAGTISNTATVAWNGNVKTNSSETIRTLTEAKICATPGKDGAGGNLGGIKNDYWPGTTTVAAGATSIVVGTRNTGGALNALTTGDLIIVMQMQDAAFDTSNDETYGEGTGSTRATGTGSGAATALNNAGRWEYAVVTATNPASPGGIVAAGGTITIAGGGAGGGLLYAYTAQSFAATTTQGQRTFQVIRVPQYTTGTLTSTLTAAPWNGGTGGILALDISGTLALGSSTVSVNGLGFRGGGGRILTGDATAGLLATDFRTLATLTTNGSKGEGIAGTPRYVYKDGATIGAPAAGTIPLDTGVEGYVNGSYGRGAPGNAGGGSTDGDVAANQDNSGGGGGGNGGAGGAGGNGWTCNCPSGGQGGGGISPSLTRVTMGGGGGAGTTNNGSATDSSGVVLADSGGPNAAAAVGYYSSGANGGGTIIIRALQATGTATLTANGFNAYNTGRDGSGGGGAGGSVLFTVQMGALSGATTQLNVQANGGSGGSAWPAQAPAGDPGERHGPGGGGGGGFILLSSAATSTSVTGGTNGTTTTAVDDYDAQPGAVGIVSFISGNNVLPGGDGASCAITDLAVTNVVSAAAIQAGANVTFTQTVTNNGPTAADGVVYMAPIPASATFVSMSVPAGWTCITPAVGAGGVVLCTTATLANAATANFSLVVNAFSGIPAGYILSETNSVSSNTPDSNPANNKATATTIVEAAPNADSFADMAVTITESTSVPTAGSNIVYSQTVSNLGSFTASSPSYTITVPANTTFQSIGAPPAGWTCITPAVGGTGTITCTGTTLASGASFSLPLTVKVNAGTAAGTVITATPSVSSTSRDPYLPNNTATISATVVAAGSGDVQVTISNSPNPVSPAENYTYTVTATNNGPAAAATDTVTIPVPAGTGFQSMATPAGWSCTTPSVGSSGNITCTIASFAANASATFSPIVQVNPTTAAGTTLTCTSTISTTSTDSIASNNTASTTNLVVARTSADVGIVKTDSPDPVGVGQLITYRLTVTNNGPAIATNVTVSDPLPSTVDLSTAIPSIGTCSNNLPTTPTTITCSLGTLPVGNSQYVDVIVQANTAGTVTNTATVTRTEVDSVPANDSSTATTTVLAVTLVRLRDFTVTQDKKKIQIAWQTSFESDNLGFNLYRETGGQRTKLNKHLIAGTGLISRKHDSEATHIYRYNDKADEGVFAQYWLEDVDTAGRHTMNGPVSAVSGIVSTAANTTPLAGLGANGEFFPSPDGFGAAHATAQETAAPAQYKQQLVLAADNGLKIYVSQEGWQRVTRAAMTAAGFDPGNDPRALSLYMLGAEQSIAVDDGGDGKFDPNDAIEFYGYPLDTISTGARTYWLRSTKGSASRVAVSNVNGGDPITGSVPFTAERVERSIFASLVNNNDADGFFGVLITTEPANEPLTVSNIDTPFGGNATLELQIQGGTDGPHIISVALAGHDLGTMTLSGVDEKWFTFTLPNSWLVNGTNNVTLTSRNGDWDVSVVAKSRLTYQHLLRADNGAFDASVAGGRAITIGGFGANTVRAFDVTDAAHPAELQTTVAADPQGGFAATFTSLAGAQRTIMALDGSRVITPAELASNTPSSWSDTNGNSNGAKGAADFYIVSNKAFIPAAGTLKAVRDKEGTNTAIVDVDDLYDEFNFGIRSPEAIRSFFQLTTTWKRAPGAFMLLGDASLDPRNYLGAGAYDFVPTRMVLTALLRTASDDWFTDFNNDGIADIPIGRIPVRTADDAALILGRIASRGTPSGTWAHSALFVADHSTDYDFGGVAKSLVKLLPSSISSQTIDFATSPSPHSEIVSAMNNGQLLVTYIGHASVEIWADYVFASTDAAALTNGNRLPVVVGLDCLNGFFFDISTDALAKALLRAPNGGAIAVWASSGLTQPDQQALMGRELFAQLFRTDTTLTLGQAVIRAKYVVIDPDVKKSWILFGDPTMKLR
jgi:uncharacterized repeat protein (TIGR01451 family)